MNATVQNRCGQDAICFSPKPLHHRMLLRDTITEQFAVVQQLCHIERFGFFNVFVYGGIAITVPLGIRVKDIAPGFFPTELNRKILEGTPHGEWIQNIRPWPALEVQRNL